MTKQKHIHFIGICGVAMSALAIAFQKKGWRVTGSDAGFFPPISTHLKENNIDFYPGWHVEKMTTHGDPDLIVVGNVASSTNPEWEYVQKNKLDYKSYPEVIAEYFVKENSIVCAGTYGKTSTTAMLTWILKEVKFDPSYMFGGLSQNNILAAEITDTKYSILEGDEYKSSRWDNSPKFSHYSPTNLLLTSIIWDHADVYPTEQNYLDAFKKLIQSIPSNGLIIACTDNSNVTELTNSLDKKVTYGKNENADYKYSNVSSSKNGISFIIEHKNNTYKIESALLGNYQAENIAGCFAMACELGINVEQIISSIKSFKGIRRRLEKRYENDITVFDDIAHSPIKAQAILETLKSVYSGKIIAVFEPNTGNRKLASFPGYDNAFAKADEVIIPRLTKIKIDTNDTEEPADGKKLAEVVQKTHQNTKYIEGDIELIKYIKDSAKKDDTIVFLGSHGFRGMIDQLITSLHQ
jgi:UDP-N-acetylmuramate: L-alanyl-gamma-D-glutamyl-meso-diaminopimelate ligase